jgi:putative intracellular protease/amidase
LRPGGGSLVRMTKRILDVVSNVSHFDDPSERTGLWLSELTHAYDVFAEAGYDQTIISPKGGPVPLEPRSLKFPFYDKSAKAWKADSKKMALLADTASPDDIDAAD